MELSRTRDDVHAPRPAVLCAAITDAAVVELDAHARSCGKCSTRLGLLACPERARLRLILEAAREIREALPSAAALRPL